MTPRLAALAAALLLACGPIPGGALSGEPAALPNDWSSVLQGDERICEVESRPAAPHSIQLECFLFERALYVKSHRFALASWWPVKSWAAIWIGAPDVRVRIGGRLYDLRAVQVRDPVERRAVLVPRGNYLVPDGIVLFRFEPRDRGEPA